MRFVLSRCLPILAVLTAAVFAAPKPLFAADLGLNHFAKTINTAIDDGKVLIPFKEAPTDPTLIGGIAQGTGYLGSIVKPRTGFSARTGDTQFYRIEDDQVCNPTDFAFPKGQAGPQRIVSANRFDFNLTGGEITIKGGAKGDKLFSLTAITAQILRRVTVVLTDIREYTLDYRTLSKRVRQVAADPECAGRDYAITKIYTGKAKVTYFFSASASLTAKIDVATVVSAQLGLSIASQSGTSEADPNTIQFETADRMFAARIRPVSDFVPARSRRVSVAAKP